VSIIAVLDLVRENSAKETAKAEEEEEEEEEGAQAIDEEVAVAVQGMLEKDETWTGRVLDCRVLGRKEVLPSASTGK
jgi:hypothetical protein